jgi:CRP/FNR family transcriptional regulator
MNIEAILQAVSIFQRMSRRQIARLARLATQRQFSAGTRILRRGETGVAMYVIVGGRVTVTLQPEGGSERLLGTLGPGDVFGEMALIDEGPRSADVTAIEDTECLLLTRWDFAGELHQDPDIARALLPVLCARIRRLEERLIRRELEVTAD